MMTAQHATIRSRRCVPALLLTTMLAAPALAQEGETASLSLEEIIVTANKRVENLQSVPISIQAIGNEKLEQLQVSRFDDYVRFLPSVSIQSNGPGFAQVYMRGVANGGDGNHSTSQPSVGVYLDEQAITTIQGALDIHMYDIARVEALAGPQGTLYGASSQAGTLRIITNKPDASGFKAGYDLETSKVSHGDIGYGAEAFVNMPLGESAAIRLVGWYDKEGGYIDNVAGTRNLPASIMTINNATEVKDDFNEVETYGGRAALKVDLNDNWSSTATLMGQKQKTEGNFGYNRALGDLKTQKFAPENSNDRWMQGALTVEGKIGNFDLVYAGAYLKRRTDVNQDYSDYAYFYDQYGYYALDNNGDYVDPSQTIEGHDRYTKMSHELRLSSPAGNRLRFIGGLFYQRQRHNIEQNYIIDGLADASAISTHPDNIWLTKQIRIDRDYAAFGEVAFDITDKLTATGGIRVFKYNNTLSGFFGYRSSEGNTGLPGTCNGRPAVVEGSPCTNLAADATSTDPKFSKKTDFIHKLNLTYKATDDHLLYLTWSRGFRPGGNNRRGTLPPFGADFLNNYEAGWKTTWADGKFRWNGAVFWEDWKNFQFSALGLGGLTEIRNAASGRIKGIESDISFRPAPGLTIGAAATYIDAKLSANYCGTTKADGSPETVCANPLAPKGTSLPVTSKFKGNVTARYEFDVAEFEPFVQASLAHQGSTWADLEIADRFDPANPSVTAVPKQKGYTTLDLSTGLKYEGWHIEAFVTNVTDSRGDQYNYHQCNPCGIIYSVPNEPRTFGIKIGQEF